MKWFAPQPFRKLKGKHGRRLARQTRHWFILASILSMPRANVHVRGWLTDDGVGPRLTVPTRGLRASARMLGRAWRDNTIVAPDSA